MEPARSGQAGPGGCRQYVNTVLAYGSAARVLMQCSTVLGLCSEIRAFLMAGVMSKTKRVPSSWLDEQVLQRIGRIVEKHERI